MAEPARSLNWPTVVGLIIVIGGPPSLVVLPNWLFGGDPPLAVHVALHLLLCAMAAAIIFLVVRVEKKPLRSIGLRKPDWMTPVAAIVLFVLAFVLQGMITAPLARRWGAGGIDAGVRVVQRWPAWFRAFVALTSGFVEETLYRGYAVEKLIAITGRTWAGATLAVLLFGAAHIPAWGGAFAMTTDLTAGAILVMFYVWRRDLIANGLAHTAGLFLGLFTIPL